MCSYDRRTAAIDVGAKMRLICKAGFSGAGFSVEITVVKVHQRPKGLPNKKQEIDVRLPDGDTKTVWAGDIF